MIIITGGAGFIGSATIWALNRHGQRNVLVVDDLGSTENWKNLRRLEFADYVDKHAFRQMIAKNALADSISAIIHLGACSSTTEANAAYLMDNNYQYTKELAEYALRNNIRFVYASSAATYGDGAMGYDDDHETIRALTPLNMYGYSKQLFDLWAANKGYLTRIAGLKFSNVFGPNEYHKGDMRSVPNKAFHQIRSSGTVELFKSYKKEYADGGQMRDFVYIKDVVAMILFIVDRPAVNGIFNVGSGQARTWNDLVKACFAALDLTPVIRYIEMPEAMRGQYQYFTELKMDKLRQAGFDQPVQSLEDAIGDYYRHYLAPGAYLDVSRKGWVCSREPQK